MLNNNILSFADGKNIKAVFFDMDGVLFDSMPYHAQAWQRALSERGLLFSLYDAYLHEGRTADSTIDEALSEHTDIRQIAVQKMRYTRQKPITFINIPNLRRYLPLAMYCDTFGRKIDKYYS